MIRTFTLTDNDGNTYDITSKNSLFFHTIDGLGFDKDATFQQIEDRFAVLSDRMAQTEIKGTIKFWQPNAEQAYFNFAQFLQNSPIKMTYNPGYNEFIRDGIITNVTRSDGKDNLEITITFSATTPWYKQVNQYNSGTIVGGKVYNYTYDYTYSSSIVNSVTIDSDSYQSSPVKLVIYGPAVNPTWRHYCNNVLMTTGKLNGTVLTNHRLFIDTTTIPYSIKQVDMLGNVVSDMYQQSDFATGRFVRFNKGRNTVSFTADNTNTLNVGVEAQIEYATV